MARWRCNNCECTYDTGNSGEPAYYHSCPGGRVFEGHGFVRYARRDMRNENIAGHGGIIAEGKGRTRTNDHITTLAVRGAD